MLRLSALAAALGRIADEGRPPSWGVGPDDRDVTVVLEHLVPIRTRAALAHSYAREGRRLLAAAAQPHASGETIDALDLAYALRWLQLDDPALIR